MSQIKTEFINVTRNRKKYIYREKKLVTIKAKVLFNPKKIEEFYQIYIGT